MTIVCSNCLVAYCIHTNYIPVCGVKPCKNRHLLEWRAVSLSTIQELTAPRCHACCPWIGGLLGPNKKVDQHLFRGRCILQGGAPSYKKWCLLVYKPHEYYSYLRTINHSEIGGMCTNLAIEWGPHLVYNAIYQKMSGARSAKQLAHDIEHVWKKTTSCPVFAPESSSHAPFQCAFLTRSPKYLGGPQAA